MKERKKKEKEKKIAPLLRGLEPATLQSRFLCSNHLAPLRPRYAHFVIISKNIILQLLILFKHREPLTSLVFILKDRLTLISASVVPLRENFYIRSAPLGEPGQRLKGSVHADSHQTLQAHRELGGLVLIPVVPSDIKPGDQSQLHTGPSY